MDENSAIDEFLNAIRPALVQLFRSGGEEARAHILSVLQADGQVSSKPPPRPMIASALGYGALTKRVLGALTQIARTEHDGADVEMVRSVCSDLTLTQVRSALKTLNKVGDASRVSRGRYLPTKSSAQAETGGVAPPVFVNAVSQSTEAAYDGPKGNGVP